MNLLCYRDNGVSQMGFVVGQTYEGTLLRGHAVIRAPEGSSRSGEMTTYGSRVKNSMIEDPEQEEISE
jgi:hypothetical protein